MTQGQVEEVTTSHRVGFNKSVLILTSSYPYPPGEQFLESEMLSWAQHFGGRVVIMPQKMEGRPREVPAGIALSSALSDAYQSGFDRARAFASSITQRIFWEEIALLYRRRLLSPRTFLNALKAATHIILARIALRREFRNRPRPDLIYTYWFSFGTYAAILNGLGGRVVTRAHRGDLYESPSPDGHLYFRRQFGPKVDRIYVISESGAFYLRDAIGADRNIRLSRLGVRIPESSSPSSVDGCVSILSVSFCVSVKNVDRIIDGIRTVAKRHPDWKIIWRHIGDGPLRASLEAHAIQAFVDTNVSWQFLGQLENLEVLRFIETNTIDFIINASSSEGVPVSIMEAMARGVPAVAPNVGGISELVSDENGIILPAGASELDIANAIADRIDHLKSSAVRARAKETVASKFNADANYHAFIEDVAAIAGSPHEDTSR